MNVISPLQLIWRNKGAIRIQNKKKDDDEKKSKATGKKSVKYDRFFSPIRVV